MLLCILLYCLYTKLYIKIKIKIKIYIYLKIVDLASIKSSATQLRSSRDLRVINHAVVRIVIEYSIYGYSKNMVRPISETSPQLLSVRNSV